MAYEHERDKIVRTLGIKDVVRRYSGVALGNRNRCACPIHGGKHLNFAVYPKTNSFYCFACGKGGDVIKFVSEMLCISYGEAIRRLDGDYCLGLFEKQHKTQRQITKELTKLKQQQREQEIFDEFQRFSYDLLLRYYRWLYRQPRNEAIAFDMAYVERLLDKHLNITENPIQLNVWALIRALHTKHRKEVKKTWI